MLPGLRAKIRFHWQRVRRLQQALRVYELQLRQQVQRLQQELGEDSSDDSGDSVVDVDISSDSEYEVVD